MVNYQLGKIHKIVDLDSNKCYVGSTTKRCLKNVDLLVCMGGRSNCHKGEKLRIYRAKGQYLLHSRII